MGRTILAISVGFLTAAILSVAVDHIFHITNVYPPYGGPMFDTGLLLVAFSYRAIFNTLGAYITAVIARENAMRAVLILGTIGSLLWLAGAVAMWDATAAWYNIIGIVSGVPLCLLGGKIYLRSRKV